MNEIKITWKSTVEFIVYRDAYRLCGKPGNSGLENQMVCIIPFGTFCKLWTTGWGDTRSVFFSFFSGSEFG